MIRVANALLVIGSLVLTTVIAECIARAIDGVPLFDFPIPAATRDDASPRLRDMVPLVAGVSRDWFYNDPPPLPNRTRPSKEWFGLYRKVEENPAAYKPFMAPDTFKAWNSVFAGRPCQHDLLRHVPGLLFLYDPPDGNRFPAYRFLPNATTPLGLVTNQIGWRGPPIRFARDGRTVRIVFVGASTTAGSHQLPFSYPEYVENWLNLWAASKSLDIRFEGLNAGRESLSSSDIAAVVHHEVLPLRPDLVVYYEGANQFRPETIIEDLPKDSSTRPTPVVGSAPPWLKELSRYLVLAQRLGAALGYLASDLDGREWPKPDYRVVWPKGLDEYDPDLGYPKLPVGLNQIMHDLELMRIDLAEVDSEFAVSSFFWLAKDGMVLDPIRNRDILDAMNVWNYPFRYRDIERLAAFQNRVFRKYAATHDLPFIDVAGVMPFEPNIFADGIHGTAGGVREQAWIVLQQLIPIIERHLADGSWPRSPVATSDMQIPPFFAPRQTAVTCGPS